jgi:hypothetical protein
LKPSISGSSWPSASSSGSSGGYAGNGGGYSGSHGSNATISSRLPSYSGSSYVRPSSTGV